MDIVINSPTKALVTFSSSDEIEKTRKALKYKNSSIDYLLFEHNKKRWWKSQNSISWQERKDELQQALYGYLLNQDANGKYWIRPGSIDYLDNTSTTNNIQYPEPKPIAWKSPPEFEPYKYQVVSVKNLISVRHGNIALPTGCGKSFILLMIAKEMGLPTVVVTPSKSIFNELLKEFTTRLGSKYVGGYGDGKKQINKLITIAIGKSLTMLEEGSEAYKHFANKQVMAVDESHTFASAELEKACHGVLSEVPYRFFVSATQTRTDGTEKLLYSIIGKNVFSMALDEAINQRYLCPLRFFIIKTFSPSTAIIKNPNKCKRTHLFENQQIAKIVAKIVNNSWIHRQESSLILVKELKQIENLLKYIEIPCVYVHSANKKKAAEFGLEQVKLQDAVDLFNYGKAKVLIGTAAISTGTNIYPTHNTINLVGGKSEIATKQGAMGRSTRLLEKSKFKEFHKPKPYTTIYDFEIKGQSMLNKQLQERLINYQESGGEIKFYG